MNGFKTRNRRLQRHRISRGKDRIKQKGKFKMGIQKVRETIRKTRGIRNLKKNGWKPIWKAEERGGGFRGSRES
jgi:hypothetical protein